MGTTDFHRSLELYRGAASLSLLVCGSVYLLGAVTCLGVIKSGARCPVAWGGAAQRPGGASASECVGVQAGKVSSRTVRAACCWRWACKGGRLQWSTCASDVLCGRPSLTLVWRPPAFRCTAKQRQEQAALKAEAELERMERRRKELERQLGRSASQLGNRASERV